jgi:hypothetical protein
MEPIGDPQAAELLRRLADMGVSPDQAAGELRRLRTTRQDRREAKRAALNALAQNEAGGILNRLRINQRGRTLDRSRRQNNYTWVVAELNSRVNERIGGSGGDRQNFTLDQLEEAQAALPEIVQQFEEEIRNAAA